MEEGGVEVEHRVKQKGWLAGEGRCCDPVALTVLMAWRTSIRFA